jgi:hypothetical protein
MTRWQGQRAKMIPSGETIQKKEDDHGNGEMDTRSRVGNAAA